MEPIDQKDIVHAMIEFAHDGILLLDTLGIIISANPAAFHILKLDKGNDAQKIMYNFTDLFDFYDFNDNKLPFEQLSFSRAIHGECIVNVECKAINKKNGNTWYGLCSAMPVINEENAISGVAFFIKDITGSTLEIKKCERDKEYYRSIISFMAEGVVVVSHDGTILDVNPAAMRLYGFKNSREAVKNYDEYRKSFILYDPDGNLLPVEKWPLSRALRGDAFSNIEVKVHRKQTEKTWIGNYSGTPVKDKAGKLIRTVLTVQDITARKHAERALNQYESYLSTIIEAGADGILAVDGEGRVIKANSRFAGLLNIPETLIEKKVINDDTVLAVASDQLIDSNAFVNKARRLNGSTEIDTGVLPLKDGRVLEYYSAPIPQDGTVIGRMWSFRDITGQTESKKSLTESEKRLRLALLAGGYGVYDFDIPAGIANVNSEYVTMLGYEPGEVRVTLDWWTSSIHPEDQKRARSILVDCMYGKIQEYKMEFRMRTKSGGYKWVLCQGKNVEYDAINRPLRMIGTHLDITDRKDAEDALREERNKLTKIAASVPGVICSYRERLDGSSHMPYASPALTSIAGFKPEEVAKDMSPMLERTHPDDAKPLLESIAKSKRTMLPWHQEYRYFHPQKGMIWIEGRSVPQREADGSTIWHGFITDITERKKAEEALREERNKLAHIAATVPGVIYSFHPRPDGSASMPYASPALISVMGVKPEEVKNDISPLFALIHPDDFEPIKKSIAESIHTQSAWHMEFRYHHPLKGEIWLEGYSVPKLETDGSMVWQGFITDITERKKAEEALREEQNKLTNIAATVPGVIYSYRQCPDGSASMPYASPALIDVMGMKPDEVADDMDPIFDLIHPDDIGPVKKSIAESFRHKSNWRREFRYNHPVKGLVWIEAYSVPQREADGSMVWHGFGRDITDRKRYEEALRLSEEKFSKVFMTSPDSISVTRLSDKVIVEVNNGTMDVFGYTREEMIGHTELPGDLGIWVNKADREKMMAILDVTGEVNGFEAVFQRKDGVQINGITSARIIKMDDDNYLLMIIRDITEQKKTEAARNRLTRELRALNSCNQALIRVENEQVLLNEICRIICEVAGYRMVWVGFKENESSPLIKVVARAGAGGYFMTGETYPLENKSITPIDDVMQTRKSSITQDIKNVTEKAVWRDRALKNGFHSVIILPLLDEAGNLFGILSIYSADANVFAPEEVNLLEELGDNLAFGISNLRLRVERKLAQRALVHEKELSDALIEATPGFFCVLNQSGLILRMNKNMARLMGQSRDPLRFVYKEDVTLAKGDLLKLINVKHLEEDVRLELKPGKISWWRVSGHAVTITETVYLIATAFDITQRKQIEENLQKALKEKEILLQELYHRTKNNMQVISSFLAMQAIALEDEKIRTILSEMENRISAMALVHEKLYKSKDLTNINLQDYLSDLANLVFRGFPAVSERVNFLFETEEIFVTMDIAIPIGLVVTELLTNSLKYAFPDAFSGSITLRVMRRGTDELELMVSDNGIGTADKFNLEQRGTIGIPTVLSIVRKQLCGTVELDTSHGFNWKFSFRCNLYNKRV